MSNPLLHIEGLPPFSQIKPEHIQPAIQYSSKKIIKPLNKF